MIRDPLSELKKAVEDYLVEYLYLVEWYYGDCRAPFDYPPKIYRKKAGRGIYTYFCELLSADPGAVPLVVQGKSKADLLANLRLSINQNYGEITPPKRGQPE